MSLTYTAVIYDFYLSCGSFFCQTLPPLLPNFKNPCWEEEVPNGFTYDDSFFNTCHYIPHTNKLKHGAQFKAFEKILLNRYADDVLVYGGYIDNRYVDNTNVEFFKNQSLSFIVSTRLHLDCTSRPQCTHL